MKDDQVVRIAAAFSIAIIYASHTAFNGSGPVAVGPIGTMHPFVITVFAELALAFPELIDRLPFGPTRRRERTQN